MRKLCFDCGIEFDAKRSAAKYCSERCKKRAQRRPGGVSETSEVPATQEQDERIGDAESLTAAVRTELAAAGRSESAAGRVVLALAQRIDAGDRESGASLASLVKEFRASMADATKGVKEAADPVDELRARRERKHTG